MSKWNIPSTLVKWEIVSREIEEELSEYGFSIKFTTSLMLAMDEIFANISAYAYGDSVGDVIIESKYTISESKRIAEVSFFDKGMEFNPVNLPVNNVVNETDSLKIKPGGLGIFIAKKQVDEIKYSYINGFNNLTLIKKESV